MNNPRARRTKLLVEELSDETLVYDLDRHRAHCLNETAAFIWQHCEGEHSVSKLAELFAKEYGGPVSDEVVQLGLDRLRRAHLLDELGKGPEPKVRYSRRKMVRKLGLAVALPVVLSIVSPTALQAATLVTPGECFFNVATTQGRCCTNRRVCRRFGRIGFCIGSAC